jgi:NitT/TauT family transport system substrate-binding protein
MRLSSQAGSLLLNVAVPAIAIAAAIGSLFLHPAPASRPPEPAATRVRIGYMPNFTHAQGILGAERGDFAAAFPGVEVEFRTFNAGPALVEALFSGEIDLAYVGPSPTVNAYAKSHGDEIRVISGSAANGTGVVVRGDAGIETPEGLAGRTIATPQLGNTQDVSARYFITQTLGSPLAEQGGSTRILNTDLPEILTLFRKGDIDAAWVPEPWATRLVLEGRGRRLFDERTLWPAGRFTTTHVIARRAFLEANPGLVRQFLRAHDALTAWIAAHPEAAQDQVNRGIGRLTGRELPAELLREAWSRIEFTTDPLADTTLEQARRAQAIGFLKSRPDFGRLYVEGLR